MKRDVPVFRNDSVRAQLATLYRSQAVIEFALDGTLTAANVKFLAAVGDTLEVLGGHHHRFALAFEREAPADAIPDGWGGRLDIGLVRAGRPVAASFDTPKHPAA